MVLFFLGLFLVPPFPSSTVKQCLRRNAFIVIQSVSLMNLLLLFWPSVHWKTETPIWSRATAIKCKKKCNKVDNEITRESNKLQKAFFCLSAIMRMKLLVRPFRHCFFIYFYSNIWMSHPSFDQVIPSTYYSTPYRITFELSWYHFKWKACVGLILYMANKYLLI